MTRDQMLIELENGELRDLGEEAAVADQLREEQESEAASAE